MTFEFLSLDMSKPLDRELFAARYRHALTDGATLIERGQVVHFLEERIRMSRGDDAKRVYSKLLEDLWPAYEAACEAEIAANMDWS